MAVWERGREGANKFPTSSGWERSISAAYHLVDGGFDGEPLAAVGLRVDCPSHFQIEQTRVLCLLKKKTLRMVVENGLSV